MISRIGNGKVILEGIWKGRGLFKDVFGFVYEFLLCVYLIDVIW